MTFYELLKNIITKLSLTVRTDTQTLSDAQKAQARANIGAMSADVEIPEVPVTSVNGKTGDVVVDVPTALADLTSDETHRVVTDSEKATWNSKANGSHTHSADSIKGTGYLATHPEFTSTIIPFIYNDLAFLTSKGGAAKFYKTTSTDYTSIELNEDVVTASDVSALFDGAPEYVYLANLDDETFVVVDIDLGRKYSYNNYFYIDYGNDWWAPANMKFYVMNSDLDTSYTLKGEYSNSHKNAWHCQVSHYDDGSGFNRVRIVLNKFQAEGGKVGRIAEIGLIAYNSQGVKETFISRGGCDGIYGNLLPNKNSDINLGSSEKHWNAIYVDEIVGAIPTVTASDSGKFLRVSDSGSWVAEAISITATDDANGNVTLLVGIV